jgi:outer membrane lipoprotein carrier protein
MRSRSLFAVFIALFFARTAGAAPDGLAEAVKRLQERYESTKTLTADFQQIVESPTLAGALESKGTLAFEKPNRMRWDYAAPDKQLVVGDGETLWIYQPEERQVIKAPFTEAFQTSTPITFLAGLGQLERDFATSLEREDAVRWVLRLVPRKDQGLGALTLMVRKTDATIEEARVTDALGTTTRLRLSAEKRNERLDPGLFRFTPPAGVDVVRPPAY